ncbi:MAG TPA: ABC transporter permease [Vicinamibacterales bacterium]|nr:ABC transporter permease [Vicinamibacterales bacterium]
MTRRLLRALFPRSLGEAHRDAIVRSVEDAFTDGSRLPTVRARAWWRLGVVTDLVKTAWLERCTVVRRRLVGGDVKTSQGPRRRELLMEPLLADLRYALRSFRRAPGITGIAVVTLALGIGATTGMFSIVHGVAFRPLPFEDPERLVMIRGRWPVRDVVNAAISEGNLADFRRHTTAFQDFAAIQLGSVPIGDGKGDAEQVRVGVVSSSFFDVLGVRPLLGRTFEEDDSNDTVVIGHGLWQRRFGGRHEVLGERIGVGASTSTIVGVLPAGLTIHIPEQSGVPTSDVAVWKVQSRNLDPVTANRRTYGLRVIARLAAGVSLADAQRQADAVAAEQRRLYADAARVNTQFDVLPLHGEVVGMVQPRLVAFLAAVGMVLLIACANVANLLLVRASSRQAEMSVRAALGAGRRRLLRQLLFESVAIAAAASLLGLMLASTTVTLFLGIEPLDLPRADLIRLDGAAVAVALGLGIVTALLFGTLPAWQASRASLTALLREAGRGAAVSRRRLARSLIVSEVALSVVLLIGAGLLARSFAALAEVPTGFRPEGTVTFRANVAPAVADELAMRLRALPGVLAVGQGSAPLAGQAGRGPFLPDNVAEGDTSSYPAGLRRVVSDGYFEAMGIQLTRGRLFEDRDLQLLAATPPVLRAVIDERLARAIWPDANPVGRRFRQVLGTVQPASWEVIGVVEATRQNSLRGDEPGTMYLLGRGLPQFVVHTALPPEDLVGTVRRELADLAPGVPMYEAQTMRAYLDRALAPDRFTMTMVAVFASVALLLAALGLYGVLSHGVGQRIREMAIRTALGAPRGTVVGLVVRDGLRLTIAGVAIGSVAAVGVSRVLSAWLYGVAPDDPLTIAAVAAMLIVVSLLASGLPARRAARLEPAAILHD